MHSLVRPLLLGSIFEAGIGTPMIYPITVILSSLLALWLLILSVNVALARRTNNVSLGDGDIASLARKIRAHGNLIEYLPVTIIVFGLAEYLQTNPTFLAVAAAYFFVGRLCHGYALSFSENNPRARIFGATSTFVVLAVMPINNLIMAFVLSN